ncbi:MAG: zinc protease [Frankiaceae bacterium]|nr:zinc protease [Frankiaceae bacterium]
MTLHLVSERPPPSEPRAWRFPEFQRHDVAGGRVLSCHLPGRPLAVVSLVVDAGAVAEPAGRQGVALLVARALSEGTAQRDAYEFAVAGERLGASWRADADWDSLRCGFEVPSGELLAATELLAEAVREPALDDATLDRVRDERLDELRVDLSQPGPRASAAFANAVFTPASRYSRPDGGDVTTVAGIGAEDVRAFHGARFAPAAATLVVVGDLAATDVEALGRSVFAGWSGAAPASATADAATQGGDRRIILVDRPGSVQSMLYVGHDAPARRTPDYVPMTTMALALGGMFNSRLNYRLREEKGYTYGAFGGFDLRRHGGVFVARTAVQSEVTAPALADLVAELELMQQKGLTDDELDRARSYRAGIFPINFAGPGSVASGLADLVVHGHPDDHFDRLRAEIQSVTTDEVNAAAATRLRPDEVVAVVVGDAAAIGDDVRATGLGPVDVVRDED